MTQAPTALTALTKAFAVRGDRPKSYVMDGIVGDAAHMNPPEGYHVSPRDEGFRWGSYSLSTTRDRAGGKQYPDYASAWDLGLNLADMILVTSRLIAAAKAKDPRLAAVAEIAGTTNGTSVHAYYVNTGKDDPNNTGGWDHSHTTHVHLSISRDDCNNYEALLPILDVICGVPLHGDLLEWIMDLPGAPEGLTYQRFLLDVGQAVAAIPIKLVTDDGKPAQATLAETLAATNTHVNRINVATTKVKS